MKYYISYDNKILGFHNGNYTWIAKSAPSHHTLATEFTPSGGDSIQVQTNEFLAKTLGRAFDDDTLAKVELLPAKEYFEAEETKANSPWGLAQAMIEGGARRILLYGPPGVGKSFTPWKVSQRVGAAFHSVTLTDMTPMAELRGHFVIRGMDSLWHDGILIRAWRDSHKGRTMMVLNEIDHVGADAESFLHNFLDDPEMARIYLPTGEELVPGNIQVIATMNGIPDDLADALKDRFTVRVEIPEPHPEALASLPEPLREFAKRMIVSPKRPEDRLSLRAFKDFVKLVEDGDKSGSAVSAAARAIFGAKGLDVVQAMKLGTTK